MHLWSPITFYFASRWGPLCCYILCTETKTSTLRPSWCALMNITLLWSWSRKAILYRLIYRSNLKFKQNRPSGHPRAFFSFFFSFFLSVCLSVFSSSSMLGYCWWTSHTHGRTACPKALHVCSLEPPLYLDRNIGHRFATGIGFRGGEEGTPLYRTVEGR